LETCFLIFFTWHKYWQAQFGSTPAGVDISTHTSHENINHTAMTVTTRKERHSVRPPVRHNWSLPGGSNQQLKKPFVFQHELLQNFSVSLFCKVCMLVFYNML
jgi:hypothetical protein